MVGRGSEKKLSWVCVIFVEAFSIQQWNFFDLGLRGSKDATREVV